MLIFFTDESKVCGSGGQQYGLVIYGGLVLTENDFKVLTDFLYRLKDRYVFPQELEAKWRVESVWKNIKKIGYQDRNIIRRDSFDYFKEDYNKFKDEVLDEVAQSGAELIVAIRPGSLLRASPEQIVDYSIRDVAKKFEKILIRNSAMGIILADELPKKIRSDDVINYQYILRLCHSGSGSGKFSNLISVIPTVSSAISPIHQINDIVLGVIQYYMLEFMRKLRNRDWDMTMAKNLLGKIVGKFCQSSTGGYIINNGILLYPPKINRRNTSAGIFLNKLERQLKVDFNID